MTALDPLAEWASLLFATFRDAGLRDVVLSPGSRSTPFVLAAGRTPGLTCWDVIDERSAAFFALGQAKTTGRASLVLCTSGSAAAHFFPALLEAEASHVPLVCFTADRPLELQGCAAPQTLDQVKLFGDHVRGFFELGLPDAEPQSLQSTKRVAVQAIQAASWPLPGPVHVNARARKPLEPRGAATPAELDFAARAHALREAPTARLHVPTQSPAPAALDTLAKALATAERPLIVGGPAPLSQGRARSAAAELAERCAAAWLVEAASQLRFGGAFGLCAYDGYLDHPAFAVGPQPDLVVQVGGPPTSSAVSRYVDSTFAERWIVAPHGWNDATSSAHHLLLSDFQSVAEALLARLPEPRPEKTTWQRRFDEAEALVQRELAALTAGPMLTEGAAVRLTAGALGPEELLFVGNSLAIRELDLFCPAATCASLVLSQRGTNGIDGLVSGAAGAASTGCRVTLLLGDVSLLHDVGGLLAARSSAGLRVVVLQNRGGRIFEDLPLAAGPEMAHFVTPHEVRFGDLARAYGCSFASASTTGELARELTSRTTLVEAVVPPTGMRALRAQLAERLKLQLDGLT